MAAASVVIDLDILKNSSAHLIPGEEAFAVDHLHLQRVEETFGAGVIVAIALGAHAAHQVVLRQKVLIQGGAILAAAVGMHDHPLGHVATPECHLKRLAGQIGGHALGHGPANDHAGEEINDHCQV